MHPGSLFLGFSLFEFSCSSNNVETTAEYEVSKALLLEWSISTQVVVAVGTNISQNLRRWIVKKILPYIPKTLLAHRLKRRTFGEYVNSVAEIEGALMKRGKDIMPYTTLATSAKNMTEKQERRIIRKSVRDVTKVTSAHMWSKSLTSTVMTVHAEGVIQGQFLPGMCQGRYSCARTNSTTWLVCGETKTAYLGASCVPTFIRTQTITPIRW
jgi:predicted membrane protein